MGALHDAVELVRSRIVKHGKSRAMNESNTKSALIEPILRALGWDVEEVDEVIHEYRRHQSDNPVDYAMLIMRTPKLFIEAKALRRNLDDAKWAHQVLGYAGVSGVGWAVLTNGDEYRIYNTHATVPVDKKLFHSVKVSDVDSPVIEVLGLLSKNQLQENTIDAHWKSYYIDQQVERVLYDVLTGEPADELVKLVKVRSDKLDSNDIKASLMRARVSINYPVDFKSPRTADKSGSAKKNRKGRDDLADVIAAGLITLPLKLEKKYRGQRVTARIELNGRVSCRGRRYNSLSVAGAAARRAVLGLPAEDSGPPTNGWTFWKFRDESGELRPMDILRKRLAKNIS